MTHKPTTGPEASRRALLALLTAGSGGIAAATQLRADSPALVPEGSVAGAPTALGRGALKAIVAPLGTVRMLVEGKRSGVFVLTPGVLPASDPLEGLFVASTRPDRYWARWWNGVTGEAEWFGAEADRSSVDCRPAIEAALALCVRVQLRPGDYHCADTLVSRLPGRKLVGSGIHYAGDTRIVTRVLVAGGRADVFRMGADRPPLGPTGAVEINRLNLEMLVEGIEFDRTAPPDTDARPRGVVVQYCQDPVVRRVKSQDSIVDFAWQGTINLLMEDCRATRARPGRGAAPDEHVGYHATTGAPALTDINGNASTRLVRCIGACTPAVPNSTGLLLDGRFTDHSIVEFETAGLAVGIRIVGDGAVANRGTNQSLRRNANVEIVRPWIDQFASVGLRIEDVDRYGIVRVSGGYFGPLAGATACIYDIASQGTILLGGEMEMAMAATAGSDCRGVLAIGTRRLLIGEGVSVMEASFRAFDLARVSDLRHAGATVNEQVELAHHTLLGDASACVLRPAMSGAPGKVGRAVEINGTATACLVDVAAMNLSALAGTSDADRRDRLLTVGGRPQASGPFGARNRLIGQD